MKSRTADAFAERAYRYPPLSAREEFDVATRAAAGDQEARHKLVLHNQLFALKQANRRRLYGHPLEELLQEANLGLVLASRYFDPTKGFRFISYAVWWIGARLNAYCMDQHSLVRIGTTDRKRRLFSRVVAAHMRLRAENPEDDEGEVFARVAEHLGEDLDDVIEMYHRASKRDVSLNEAVFEGAREARVDRLPAPSVDADAAIDDARRDADVRAVVRRWARSAQERLIVERRVLCRTPETLEKIGGRLGVTRERARQIEARLVSRLKEDLHAVL